MEGVNSDDVLDAQVNRLFRRQLTDKEIVKLQQGYRTISIRQYLDHFDICLEDKEPHEKYIVNPFGKGLKHIDEMLDYQVRATLMDVVADRVAQRKQALLVSYAETYNSPEDLGYVFKAKRKIKRFFYNIKDTLRYMFTAEITLMPSEEEIWQHYCTKVYKGMIDDIEKNIPNIAKVTLDAYLILDRDNN